LPPNARVEPGAATLDSDEDLVARCRERRDEAAFAELVGRYRTRVFRLAVSILGQGFEGEAEEVTQEVMLRVHHSLTSFRGEAKVGSWIYRIAFNQAANLKARVRYRAPHVGADALAAIASPDADPHDRLQAARRSEALLACVAELPDVYQSALRLHYWMGESVADIAALLDAPENTIKSYLHRARQLLHAMLDQRGFHE
jgi:RNA polymerase sigma-70 factor (ECF subfamily)